MPLRKKIQKINTFLTQQSGVVVALSGGVDSALLLQLAKDVLNDRVIAVTAASLIHPQRELTVAKQVAKKLGVRHIVYRSGELRKKAFTSNPRNRCYYCKRALFRQLKRIAAQCGYTVIEGSNASDAKEDRPGMRALRTLKIVSPFIDAGLHKHEIRKLARTCHLPNWNKPATACLATRVPFGRRITPHLLKRIELAECYLKKLKIAQVRVRDHDTIARIEIMPDDASIILTHRRKITDYFHRLGYKYITLDINGYRTGSLNE